MKGSKRGLPSRRDLDPIEIPKLLPHIGLADVLRCDSRPSRGRSEMAPRFRMRLIGTALGRLLRRQRAGAALDRDCLDRAGPDPMGELLDDLCARAAADLAPVRLDSRVHYRGLHAVDVKWLALPLSANGALADMILFSGVALEPESGNAEEAAASRIVERVEPLFMGLDAPPGSREAAL